MLIKHHATKMYEGVKVKLHALTLTLGRGKWLASRPGKRPQYPLDSKPGGLQSQCGYSGEEKNFCPAVN
jgi:hypothetical protein